MNSEQAIIFASSLISKLDNINILDTVKKELPKTRCFTQTQRKSLEVNIKISFAFDVYGTFDCLSALYS